MGFWSRLLGIDSYDAAQRVLADPYEPYFATAGIPVMDPGTPLEFWVGGQRTEIERFWRSQPNVRKVVDFIARNVASIPLHTFERVSDIERRRVTGHPLPDLLGAPRPKVGPYRFWHSVMSDGLLYDRWLVLRRVDPETGRDSLVQVPSWRTRFKTDALRQVTSIWYWTGDSKQGEDGWLEVDMGMAIFDHGYAPATAGLSPIATLRDILDESSEAVAYRRQVWENGGRFDQYVHRPATAPEWNAEQRSRWATDFRSAYASSKATRSGGMPLMEDGMEIRDVKGFASKDALDLDGRTLTAIEVAAAFHVAPEMVGAREGNYSNMKEFRQSLYRDSLGPYITAWEEVINSQLVPRLADGKALYVEANVKSKLRGSFEEEAQVGQASVGAPTMTRNEWRARQNMPPVPGGDELITPLNVLVGGQASPADSGSQNVRASSRPAVKAVPVDGQQDEAARTLEEFLARQGRTVLSRLGAGADWWDAERWDAELAEVLAALYLLTATSAGRATLEDMGLDPDGYDEPRTRAYLERVAQTTAGGINETTRQRVEEAIEDGDDATEAAWAVFGDVARAAVLATAVVTFASGWGSTEAASQREPRATKTWRTTSGNSRSSHARMNGETVPVGERFSNGMRFPGDDTDLDETAGCQCVLTINRPTAN